MSKRQPRPKDKAPGDLPIVAAPYEPTKLEREATAACQERNRNKPQTVGIKLTRQGEVLNIGLDHPDVAAGSALLCNSLGTGSHLFAGYIVQGLVHATTKKGEAHAGDLNDALSVVQALHPHDEVEAMLMSQMAMIHQAAMHCARRLSNSDNLEAIEAHDRGLNRLSRTYAAQMEALKRYRTGGQQRVTVEHVHVHQGGQAIVGAVHHGSGGGGAGARSEATP
jgi:hypothetical protein